MSEYTPGIGGDQNVRSDGGGPRRNTALPQRTQGKLLKIRNWNRHKIILKCVFTTGSFALEGLEQFVGLFGFGIAALDRRNQLRFQRDNRSVHGQSLIQGHIFSRSNCL